MDRVQHEWMQDLMVCCAELDAEDVEKVRSTDATCRSPGADVASDAAAPPPSAPAPPSDAAAVPSHLEAELEVDDDTLTAMLWATRLTSATHVIRLCNSLPVAVVEEQVVLYKAHLAKPAVADEAPDKIIVSYPIRAIVKHRVVQSLYACLVNAQLDPMGRIPRSFLSTFMESHVDVTNSKGSASARVVAQWFRRGRSDCASTAVAQVDISKKVRRARHRFGAPLTDGRRRRKLGGGRKYKAGIVREALYEWWVGLRYSIDWKALKRANRSRGKQCLARIPRVILRSRAQALQADYAAACLLVGDRVDAFKIDSHWLTRWESSYGLSLRVANRKFSVSRAVLKERLQIFWVNLFRVRKLIQLTFGYDPDIENWDQSPYHHNETGAQDKRVLAVRDSMS